MGERNHHWQDKTVDAGTFLKADFFCHGPGGTTQTDYAQPDVRCDLAHGTGDDPCDGPLDRFGRVTDFLWYDYGSSADLLRFKHGYDRAGNRLYREEADTSDLDQLYSYDDVNRLIQSEEGTLSAGKDSISSLNFAQQWSLDATGNWSAFKEDDDGDATWDLEQTRTSNAVNEITDVGETTGPSWITPAYNRAGNMTTIPQPADPTQSYAATYDAWNRLVKLEDGEDTVAEYVFDGAKRLVVRKKYASGSLSQTRHFYHTAQWQTIEERLESGGSILSTADRQFTWGRRYIDDLVCRTVNSVHDYAYQDPNWNVILSSTALARVLYQPYGQIRSTCPAASGDLDDWQHYFAGYRRDEDTGLYLVRHRVYQPELGCWVQRDPIGYGARDVNLVRYVVNVPTRLVDPDGTIGIIIGIGIGIAVVTPFLAGCCGRAPKTTPPPFVIQRNPLVGSFDLEMVDVTLLAEDAVASPKNPLRGYHLTYVPPKKNPCPNGTIVIAQAVHHDGIAGTAPTFDDWRQAAKEDPGRTKVPRYRSRGSAGLMIEDAPFDGYNYDIHIVACAVCICVDKRTKAVTNEILGCVNMTLDQPSRELSIDNNNNKRTKRGQIDTVTNIPPASPGEVWDVALKAYRYKEFR